MAEPGSIWTVGTGYKITTLIERSTVSIRLPLVSYLQNPSAELISGSLPRGCRLEGLYIVGTAYEVIRDTSYKFTIRVYHEDIFEDRTLEIVVSGPDEPIWLTNEGLLPVGSNEQLFILDNSIIDYQLIATDPDISAGDELEYFIAEGDGQLPPGISLTEDGRLTGIVEPLLALDQRTERGGYDAAPYGNLPIDFAALSNNGYGSYFYDSEVFDFNTTTNQPKKLNRYYPFRVTVTDGDTFTTREFKIYLVGDDYLKSDNTLMHAGTGVFTSDATNVRTPVWLTPNDLGYKRADNFVILPIETIENDQLEGIVRYTLEDINNDGTPSVLPTGLNLDYSTGTITGYLPYQPAVVKDHKFTLRATRLTFDLETVEIFGTYYEDVLLGNSSFKIYKTDLTGLDDGVNDLLALRGRQILIKNRLYNVINVDDSNTDYDVIFLDETLAPEISLVVSQTAKTGQSYFFANRLGLKEKEKYKNRTLKFSETEKYTIGSIVPYIEYDVVQISPQNNPIFPYYAPSNIEIGESYFVDDYVIYDENLGGNGFIYKCVEAHTTEAQIDGDGDFILDANGNQQIIFEGAKWTQVAETLEELSLSNRLTVTRQAIQREYGGPVYITAKDDRVWNVKLPSTSLTRIKQNISQFFKGADSSDFRIDLIRDNEDRIELDINLQSNLNQGRNIGIALFQNDFFSKNIVISNRDEVDIPSSIKTFELKTIGEIDSTIAWITDSDLGTIAANLQSTLSVKAESTVPDTKMIYSIISGKLPNGMSLTYDGEIIGVPRQYQNSDGLGLTYFDGDATWDGSFPGDTLFDRQFKFTVQARDRFNYATLTREFVLVVEDNDNTKYTKIYMKPMLKETERSYLQSFTSNSDIFEPEKIYRPQDPEFGIQTDLELLVYSGIEAKNINNFVSAAAKNHKRKKYILGSLQSAFAKLPGTNDVIYEVVYIPVIDPANATKGTTAKSFKINTTKQITVDSMLYNSKDDVTKTGAGYDALPIYGRNTIKFIQVDNNEIIIETKDQTLSVDADESDFEIVIRSTDNVTIELQVTDSEPYKIQPQPINTIKVDSNAINISQSKDNLKYISSLDNMRDNISTIGKTKRSYLPLWMRTPQVGLQELDYIPAIPLCYCKPGYAADIIRNLNGSNFDPKKLNYDIDRYIVKSANDKENETFILFANYQFNE